MRRLAIDYTFHFDNVAPFFAGDPQEPRAWADSLARVRAHERPRAGIAAVIAAQQERREAPAPARAMAAKLADASTVAVVTGQQAGLFGGPLYTLLKAMTAIRLAARTSREHGTVVVPVFWIDAEDHDWNEIAACGVLDGNQAWREIRVAPPDGAGDRPVAALTYTDEIDTAIAELEQALPHTEFTRELTDALRHDYTAGPQRARRVRPMAGANLLGPLGLVVFDASDPAAKPFAASLFRAEIEHAGRTTRLAVEAGSRLTDLRLPRAGNARRGQRRAVRPRHGQAPDQGVPATT